jgi:CHAT domain-containing protein
MRVGHTIPALQHETVISFASLPSGVAAWAFDNRGVNFAWIAASNDELAGRIRDFAHRCGDPYSDLATLQQQGRSLYDLLIAPFERQLEPSRLLIVEPDSILNDVPWQALVDPQGKYLGSRFAIVVSPGLGYWLNLRPPAAISPEGTALIVGMPSLAPVVASRFAPLPDADREAQSVASQFLHARLLYGTEVTALAIKQELARSDVFHFAGHAVSGVKQSGLVLASPSESDENADEPRLLSGSDLQSAMLQRLQLVVLSACATAETEKGFGVPDTLVRNFLRAGVPHVVASRWPVDSRITERTIAEFYKALFQGQPSTKALQQAANTLRLQPGTSHPYYWAAFGSYGR